MISILIWVVKGNPLQEIHFLDPLPDIAQKKLQKRNI